jgi:dolichol kinase
MILLNTRNTDYTHVAEYSFVKELLRKSIHLTSLLIVLVYAFYGRQAVLTLLISYLVLILVIEHLRLDRGLELPFVKYLFRRKEISNIGSHVFFTLGALVAVAVFSKEVAYAAILMTTFGDMSAALIGRKIGKHRFLSNGKSVEGCTAEFIVDLFIGYVFLSSLPLALLMAFTATLVETLFVNIDDNLAIPVFSGFVVETFLYIKALV